MTAPRPNYGEPEINVEAETAVVTHDWDGDTSLSRTIVSTIQNLSGSDPRTFDRLYDRVDPDSLETIFESPNQYTNRNDGQVSFRLDVYSITVHANGTIVVTRT